MPVFTGLQANWHIRVIGKTGPAQPRQIKLPYLLSATFEGVLLLGFGTVEGRQCGLAGMREIIFRT
jgi:hypothetical protein